MRIQVDTQICNEYFVGTRNFWQYFVWIKGAFLAENTCYPVPNLFFDICGNPIFIGLRRYNRLPKRVKNSANNHSFLAQLSRNGLLREGPERILMWVSCRDETRVHPGRIARRRFNYRNPRRNPFSRVFSSQSRGTAISLHI